MTPAARTNFTEQGIAPAFEMIFVEGGTFLMGGADEEAYGDEKPVHKVQVYPFYLARYPVTQALWQAVMRNNPSNFKGADRPVERVSWDDCQDFLQKLNAHTGKNYRLPTEAEWEYAARGGAYSEGYLSAGSDKLKDVGWYDENSGNETHPVGEKLPNELGLYDLSGNVWEWCEDWYGSYPSGSQTNPTGPSRGSDRVSRGGSWISVAQYCRVSYRYPYSPEGRDFNLGFRLALPFQGDGVSGFPVSDA